MADAGAVNGFREQIERIESGQHPFNPF